MNDQLVFLLVTANEHETNAVLNSGMFNYKEERAKDPDDTLYYHVGEFGRFSVVHFELPDQGSVGSDASALSINAAIKEFSPDAVILIGIAFGKENPNPGEESLIQPIGTVLISEKVADYESGKMKNGTILPDGAIPEAGRQLLAEFRHASNIWTRNPSNKVEFGLLLSGDKVVDDPAFKASLWEKYPRAIGGEMEGRGAYAVCRRTGISEWIIIKAVCDYGDGYKGDNKEERQIKASSAAVSLLEQLFNDPDASGQMKKKKSIKERLERTVEDEESHRIIGYCINFGVTSCRLFKIVKERNERKGTLKEFKIISYENTDTKSKDYLSGIIDIVKNQVKPIITSNGKHVFFKAFADASFEDVFSSQRQKDDFISEMYDNTDIFFNVLTQKQTEANLKKLFRDMGDIKAIINIGSLGIEILADISRPKEPSHRYVMFDIDFSLNDIKEYLSKNNIQEKWTDQDIKSITDYIKKNIDKKTVCSNSGYKLSKIKADKVVIIKNELDFMEQLGYELSDIDGRKCIEIDRYRDNNSNILFKRDFKKYVNDTFEERSKANRFYGFKNGHILLQTIFEIINANTIIPSNELSIHGSDLAYIFNVVISGSTNGDNKKYMQDAYKLLTKRGVSVLSPRFVNGKVGNITKNTHRNHAHAIRECDLLFVCNGNNGYIGEQTGREIYGAYVANKPIAFWKEPPQEQLSADIEEENPANVYSGGQLDYIPHELWGEFMRVLEEE